ncbi:17-beta-hydroxysteroid dehydrogenase 13-like isoform X2 [Topomyia yanbarensis]|uniref:17-beta-hydroxysteroid dehydrogenase 13-like isoform X2 n=1 Tax=Topomyia yanbarensis TaxID=2498891 RepID=UPI00273A97E9|nr:17-beta-hydroxysteroid dehydrogenase 13-like isoform X2 [Topomyia yanbarensis]
MMDFSTFLLLLVPILIGYLIRLFVPAKKKKIAGQLALVTGGANGLGRELCLQLAMKGCHIVVADLDTTNGEKTAEDLRKLGVKAKCFKADISDYDSVVELKRQVESSLGNVDILVNNAGVLPLMSIREGKPEDLKKVMEINLLSHFWTIRIFLDGMILRQRGHIVAIASVASYVALGRMACYSASKFGVHGLMESFNDELRNEGLRDKIFTTTAYPFFMNTRNDLISRLAAIKVLGRVPVFSPKRIAIATIDGMLFNQKQVFVPSFAGALLTRYVHLPGRVRKMGQTILFKRKLPRLMEFDESETEKLI